MSGLWWPVSHLKSTLHGFHAFSIAAHCFESIKPEDITAIFGRLNITNDTEHEWSRKNISAIKSHKNFGKDGLADSDIAVLILAEEVKFTMFIQPICLPTNIQKNFTEGTIVGYGKVNESSKIQEIPLHAVLQTIDLNTCNSSNNNADAVLSPNNFCAKNSDDKGYACEGTKAFWDNFNSFVF